MPNSGIRFPQLADDLFDFVLSLGTVITMARCRNDQQRRQMLFPQKEGLRSRVAIDGPGRVMEPPTPGRENRKQRAVTATKCTMGSQRGRELSPSGATRTSWIRTGRDDYRKSSATH